MKEWKIITFLVLFAILATAFASLFITPRCEKTLTSPDTNNPQSALSIGIVSSTEATLSVSAPCGIMDPFEEPDEWFMTKKLKYRGLGTPPDGFYTVTITGEAGSHLITVFFAKSPNTNQKIQKEFQFSEPQTATWKFELRNGNLTAE